MDASQAMKRWMAVVGVVYVLMGVRLLPWINGAMIESGLGDIAAPGIDLDLDSSIFEFLVDWMGVFGLDLVVLGAVLVYAAWHDPLRHRLLVVVVIGQEAIRGVLADLWLIGRDYSAVGFYLGFIVFHLIVIGTGLAVLRRTRTPAGSPA